MSFFYHQLTANRLQIFLLFVRYEEEFERSERVVLPRRNPFQE